MSEATTSKTPTNGLPPKHPRENWLFGNAWYLLRFPLDFLQEGSRTFNGIYLITSRFLNMVAVHEPEYVKYILQDNNRNYIKWFRNDVLEMLLGNGLLTSDGDFWRKQRRLAQPAFHRERLALMLDTMVDCTREQIERIERLQQKRDVDISKEMMALTLNIVAHAMFSSDVKSAIEVVSHEIEIANQLTIDRFRNPFRLPNRIPTLKNLYERRTVAKLDAVLNPIIEDRRKSTERFDDLLAMLMEAKDEETGEQMTNRQLRDETMTIFLAGHETTAVALGWIWYLLDKNPEKAQKLYDEVETVLEGRSPGLEDLHKLQYTRLVIDEALRIYPPAWLIGRENIEADEIGGYHIPPGFVFLIPVYSMHHDPKIWEDAETFKPERFLKENMKDKHRFAYFPFGGGPRQCIGNNFALMELQVIVAMMVQKFRFKITKGYAPEMNPLVTLRSKKGMRVDVLNAPVERSN